MSVKRFFLFFVLLYSFSVFSQKNVSVKEAKQLIQTTRRLQIVDVRTISEYKQGHISNSILIDWKNQQTFDLLAKKQLKKRRPILVYCRSGRRSSAAMKRLVDLGFKTVYNLEGGIIAWNK
jgi:rhodanese-related sulfurtransferase